MVSSSLDKNNIKNAKDSYSTSVSVSGDLAVPVLIQNTNNINLINNNLTRSSSYNNNVVGLVNDCPSALPSSEKIQMLFPKCKPKSEYPLTASSKTLQDTSPSSSLIPIESTVTTATTSSYSQPKSSYNNTTQINSSCIGNSSFNLSNSKLLKLQPPISPSKKKLSSSSHMNEELRGSSVISSSAVGLKNKSGSSGGLSSARHEANNFAETNPFRINNSSNRYFYNTSNDSLFGNNNNNNLSVNNSSSIMHQQHQQSQPTSQQHHYNCPPLSHRSYQLNNASSDDRDYYFDSDEVEHNPYVIDTVVKSNLSSSTMNTIPSSILKTTPPATPPALTMSPVDSSPLSNRNMWDLSPIKTTTPTRIKTQSPINLQYPRSNRGSYKKLLASPVPIEEDLETGHVYSYGNKTSSSSVASLLNNSSKKYYQALQMDNNSSSEFTLQSSSVVAASATTTATTTSSLPQHNENHESTKMKCSGVVGNGNTSSSCSKQLDYSMYDEYKIKDERRMVKSKSGSGIMEYDGSPRRFGMSSTDDIESQAQQSYKINLQQATASPNSSSPSPPRPGFPQRILSHHQYASTRSKSPSESMKKSYSYDSAMSSISSYPAATQKLLPTTFISNKPYSSSSATQEKAQTIDEESETNIDDDEVKMSSDEMAAIHQQPEASSQLQQQHYVLPEISHAFQVTSPTEDTIPTSTFDYLYEFSETRKVLEEFFKVPDTDKIKELEKFSDFNESDDSLDIQYDYRGQLEKEMEDSLSINKHTLAVNCGGGLSTASAAAATTASNINQMNDIDDDNRDDKEDEEEEKAYMKTKQNGFATVEMKENNKSFDYLVDSGSRSSLGDDNVDQNNDDVETSTHKRTRRMSKSSTNNNNYTRRLTKNFNYSPDTTDYDSNYGDYEFESENSLRFLTADYPTPTAASTYATSTLPTATVDLSGGPNNYARFSSSMSVFPKLEDGLSSGHASDNENNNPAPLDINFYNKRNNNSSSISTIQKQYQDSLAVQSQAKNTVLSGSNNSTFYNNNNMLNNAEESDSALVVQTKHSRSLQSTSNSHASNCYSQQPPAASSMRRETGKDGRFAASTVVGGASLSSASHISANNKIFKNRDPELESLYTINTIQLTPPPPAPVPHRQIPILSSPLKQELELHSALMETRNSLQSKVKTGSMSLSEVSQAPSLYSASNNSNVINNMGGRSTATMNEQVESPTLQISPVWIPRSHDMKPSHSPILHEENPLLSKGKGNSDEEDEEEIDTDLETDRLLGHQMLDDGFYDDKNWSEAKQLNRTSNPYGPSKISPKVNQLNSSLMKSKSSASSSLIRHGLNTLLPTTTSSDCCMNSNSPSMLTTATTPHFAQSRSLKASPSLNSGNLVGKLIHTTSNEASPERHNIIENIQCNLNDLKENESNKTHNNNINDSVDLCNLDSMEIGESPGSSSEKSKDDLLLSGDKKKKNKNKEVLIEGVLFRARYLGSTQLVCEGQPTKSTRMMQAEEAVSRIKALAPDGENQPSTEVDLFISTEKIMVLNTDLKEIMMDHALRTISYIADIGDLVVLMARRRFVPQDVEANSDSGTGTGGSGNVSGGSGGPTPPTSGKINRTPKMICHVFESEEAQFIAQSIGQAFQVAYMEFLKANGIEDHSFMKEMDYQEVLNSQEIFGDELEIFAKKELQKEVVVPKTKGEILGVVIVESGWGSMLPTVVIANLAPNGAAARCGHLNIGDQIIAINGLSLVGLPLSQCQSYIKNTKNQTVVKFTVVPCAPVVEVKIKRPNTKYQLGFSVQNGVICSLLRGGIAERGGVRVGHRIIEINNQSVVAVPHEKIVNLLATSVGEIHMKTMPTSMFRLLTGQENPIYI